MLINKRIHEILLLLKDNVNLGYTELYKELIKLDGTKVSHRDFSNYLNKLELKKWIKKQGDNRRGTSVSYSITDLGLDCYIYQINFEEYDNYEKSFYLLFFLMGIGVPYDSTKLTDEEIRNIHLQKNYCSISINDLKRNIINKEYVFFGYIDFKHYSDDKIASIFKFLIDKQILIYDADRDRYNLKNPKFQRFINNCWSILCQRTFRIMFEYIYTYIRKPQENENEWLKLLFDKNANNMFEREYHKKRSERKELLKNKDVNSPEIKLIKGENLITNLKLILNRLNSDINWLKKEYLESSFDNEHLFFINRILTIIYPEFIQKDDFIKNLKIKSNKNY